MVRKVTGGLMGLFCSVLMSLTPVVAQPGRASQRPAPSTVGSAGERLNPGKMVATWKRTLTLSEAQVSVIRPMIERLHRDVRLVLHDQRLGVASKRERIRSLRLSTVAQARTQLNADQVVKFDRMQSRLNQGSGR